MIKDNDIVEIGSFLKPHGIAGEITFAPLYDGIDLLALKCLVVNVDGINVPFFIEKVRKKGDDKFLVKIDDLDDEKSIAMLSRHDVFALNEDVEIDDTDDGFSAYDFIGYRVVDKDNGREIGTVKEIDDATENWLFRITPKNDNAGKDVIFIPVVDEFITDINVDDKVLVMNLPEGLVNLN